MADDESERAVVNPGELGGHPMPGSSEHGRAIPNQASVRLRIDGVRNEQEPGAKANVCSELYGNVESAAEMTALLVTTPAITAMSSTRPRVNSRPHRQATV